MCLSDWLYSTCHHSAKVLHGGGAIFSQLIVHLFNGEYRKPRKGKAAGNIWEVKCCYKLLNSILVTVILVLT